MGLTTALALFGLLAGASASVELDSEDWTVCNTISNLSVPAGHARLALIAAGTLQDPLCRFHELSYSLVATESSWTYSRSFSTPPAAAGQYVTLELDSVDSISSIFLNGQRLAPLDPRTAGNAHVPQHFAVEELLKTDGSDNTLEVRLDSVLQEAERRAGAYPYAVPAAENYNVWAEPNNRPFVRKAGSDFGWDWGPAFVGIPGSVRLVNNEYKIEVDSSASPSAPNK